MPGFHERLRDRGWTDVRPAFGFVLLALRDSPSTTTELATVMGITKQTASKLVDTMVEAGYFRRGTADDDGRRRPLDLTGRGRHLLAAVEAIYAELEAGWAGLVGTTNLEAAPAGSRPPRLVGAPPPVRPTW